MKIVFSRKGFDSSSGGGPSPIFPDGQMLSLPIPDKSSRIPYKDISGNSWASVEELISDLTDCRPSYGAHLDPDLERSRLPREKSWRPLFGQVDSAQSHLENHGVGAGDVFLFFGLFRAVERVSGRWNYLRNQRQKHVIFGWLQIDEMIDLRRQHADASWADYHPHFSLNARSKNVLYVAKRILELPGLAGCNVSGAGTFPRFVPDLQLTDMNAHLVSRWLLPRWFHPDGHKSVLSYHGDLSRWQLNEHEAILSTVGRGQEFVLDCDDYPEAVAWLVNLMKS